MSPTIPKAPPFFSIVNYQPISITSALSKVFERVGSGSPGRFLEHRSVLPTTQFAYRKGLGTFNAFFFRVSCTAKCIGEWVGG